MHSILPLALHVAGGLLGSLVNCELTPLRVAIGETEMIYLTRTRSAETAGDRDEIGEVEAVLMRPQKRIVLRRLSDGSIRPVVTG